MTDSDHTLEVPKYEGNTLNFCGVGARGDSIVVLKPQTEMPKIAALIHAAQIVAIADQSENFVTFRGILKAVLEA
jgi:hypothetical protein